MNFEESEFFCKCGCALGFQDINSDSFKKIQKARSIAGIPFVITSSIRCKVHNISEGGSPTSSHLIGRAFDIKCGNSRARFLMIQALVQAGFNRIGVGSNFIHVDDDPKKSRDVIWLY